MSVAKRSDVLSFRQGDRVKSYRIVSKNPDAKDGNQAEALGEGGSGIVFRAEQELHGGVTVSRAMKFFMYRDDIAQMTVHASSGPVSGSQFLDELVNVASFRHENIVKVVDVGAFEPPTLGAAVPFIVTDFVNGPTLQEILKKATLGDYIADSPHRALDLLSQICRGVEHLHRQHFYHCDIAPKNIFLQGTPDELVAVIGDLGIGRRLSNEASVDHKVFVMGTWDYSPPEAHSVWHKDIPIDLFRRLQPRWDLYAVAKTGLDILEALDRIVRPTPSWQRVLRSTLSDMVEGAGPHDIRELLNRILWLRPIHRTLGNVPELAETFEGRRTRLLALHSPVTSRRVRQLFDHPAVLRLKRVPQLFMGAAVFAGANHTRYEHTQGVYENMRRYVLALIDEEGFLKHFDQQHVETGLVAAALSNLCSVPFAHVIAVLRSARPELFVPFSQETLLNTLLTSRFSGSDVTLESLISDEFPAVSLVFLRALLAGRPPADDAALRFLHSALEGSLGAVVVDYVRRDSWHLGISRGDAVDLTELLQHIAFHEGALAILGSGLSIVEELITQRYWLYARAYWNQPHRALHAMLRHLLAELHTDVGVTDFANRLLDQALHGDEHDVLTFCLHCAEDANRKDLCDLVSFLDCDRPAVYEQAFQINRAESRDASLDVVWDKITGMNALQLSQFQKELTIRLNGDVPCSQDYVEILIDMPTSRRKFGEDVNVLTRSGVVPLMKMSPIVEGVRRGFEQHIQRARVFVHPRHAALVKSGKLGEIVQRALRSLIY